MSFTIGSLFDGSGGFPLAAAMCGGIPVWASEIEPYPIAVTRSRFPQMTHLGSVTDVRGDLIQPVDVITFGSPCQDLSIAGKRAGLKHENNGDEETTRSGLFLEAVRIIKEMREATNGEYPKFALWENVPGAFNSNKGEDFRIVLEELIKICEPSASLPTVPKNGWPYADHYCGDGWSIAYRVLNAEHWGVAQRRRRCYLVLHLGGNRAGQVCFERPGLRGYFAEGKSPWQGTPRDAETGADPANRETVGLDLYNFSVSGDTAVTLTANSCVSSNHAGPSVVCIATQQGGAEIREDDVCPTVTAAAGMSGNNQPWVCYEQMSLFENHSQDSRYRGPMEVCPMLAAQLGTGGNNTPFVVKSTYQETGIGWWNESEVGATLRTPCGGDATKANVVVMATGQANAEILENRCPNLTCNHEAPIVCGVDCRNGTEYPERTGTLQSKPNGGFSLNCNQIVRVKYIVRRLTPTECARLQGFADTWAVPDHKDDFTDEEYAFWSKVRNDHAAFNGKETKVYTKKQMLTWYNKLRTDSAEYRLWGNGIALPTTLYMMQGIADALEVSNDR